MATIILVNDERILRTLIAVALRRRRYTVREAATAAGALRQAGRRSAAPDLLLAELSLPGMNGLELARKLTADHPGMRSLLLSRYPHRSRLVQRARDEGWKVLDGAFRMEKLIEEVGRTLGAKPGARKPARSENAAAPAPGKVAVNGESRG